MALSKANHTDGNASTRQVAVATRALCWSFDLAAIFLTLYQFGCRFVFPFSLSLAASNQIHNIFYGSISHRGLYCLAGFFRP